LPDLSKPVYVAEGLSSIPPHLSADFVAKKVASREALTELVVADLGDTVYSSPYLIV
jgi:cleavage and polyadenylation specificity factor subunit 1